MNNKKLSTVLKTNAAFSIINAFVLILFKNTIADLMNISQTNLLVILSVGLLLFAGLLLHTASEHFISPKKVKFIILQDWLWVVGSALIIFTQAFGISQTGFIIIGVIACIVADFAILQQRFLRVKNE